MENSAKNVEDFYDELAPRYDFLKKKNRYYHEHLTKLYKFLIPKQQKVIEIGCATGSLLNSVASTNGVGVDISHNMMSIAKKKFSKLKFIQGDINKLSIKQKFDYVILSDLIGILIDIETSLTSIKKLINDDGRIIINYNNYFWEPILTTAASFGIKIPQPTQSWLSDKDIQNLLELADLDVIKKGEILLIPFDIPFLSDFLNKYVARLPLIRNLCFVKYLVVRKKINSFKDYSVSIILPARNEAGNIEKGVREIPKLGTKTEIIFVEDHSRDNTLEEIKRVVNKYKSTKNIRYFTQTNQYGKAAAVRKGFENAKGDIIFVFDSDLTVDPSDLPKFYEALKKRKADLVQGSRLIYPIEKDAMRFLNILGNKFFSAVFTFLLDQPIKDTLCGTKGMFRSDYQKIVKNRSYFGNFDPFGDFDLIFGSVKLNLKIMEIPIRYKARIYGKTNISRFRNGWQLLLMTFIAAKKIKFF